MWGREAIPKNDTLGGGEILGDHSVAIDNKGNAYAFGWFWGQITFGNDTIIANGEDLFLVKYDVNGSFIWVKQIKENIAGGNDANSVAVNDDGNIYITGYFNDTLSFGAIKLISTTSYNTFIAKYDTNGNFIWAKQATLANNGNSAIYASSLAADNSGNIYVTGYFLDTVYFGADKLKTSPNYLDFFLAKFNPNGNVVWAKQGVTAGSSSFDASTSIALDMDGNPFITGYFTHKLMIGNDTLITHCNNGDVFIAKYDSDGNILWVNKAKGKNDLCNGIPTSISIDRYGDAYLTGYFSDTLSFGANMLTSTTSFYNAFLVKYNGEQGNVFWANQGENIGVSSWAGYSVATDTTEGGGYLTMAAEIGPYQITFGKDSFNLNTTHLSATIFLQFDSAGNTICGKIFTEGDEDDGDGVGLDHSGKFVYMSGDLYDTTIFGPDTLTYGYELDNPFITRWQSCSTIVTDISQLKLNESIAAYPNPFRNYTTIVVNSDYKHYLELDDITGRKLKWFEFTGNKCELFSMGLAPGMYFVRVFDTSNTLLGTSKIIVQ
jgi:hypothetical protein